MAREAVTDPMRTCSHAVVRVYHWLTLVKARAAGTNTTHAHYTPNFAAVLLNEGLFA